jgi:hypothetical protein
MVKVNLLQLWSTPLGSGFGVLQGRSAPPGFN